MKKREIKKVYFIEAKSPREHIYSLIKQPRLGTALLATILNEYGYTSKVFIEDITELDWKELNKSNLIGISSITSTAPRAFRVAGIFKSLGKIVVMGGPHSTFLPEESLQYVDYVVRGEGEETIVELIEHLNAGRPLDDIPGLSFKKNGKIVHNPDRPLIQDLNSIPIPNLKLIDGWEKIKAIPVATSRGCPYGCRFCSVIQMFGRGYRFNSVERVIEELQNIVLDYPGKHVFFIDDNFAANKERTKELLRKIISENIKIGWSAQVRTDIVKDSELVDLMKKAGCYTVFVGFESVNPETLKQFNKHQTVQDIENCIAILSKAEINIHGMFVTGGETDNIKTIRETAKFAKRRKLSSIQFLMLTPLPGTPTFEELKEAGRIIHTDWSKYDAHHVVFEPRHMTPAELHIETLKAMKKFYSWGAIIKNLFQGKFFYAAVGLYGNKTTRKFLKLADDYLKYVDDCLRRMKITQRIGSR